jgi:glutamate carboxypeptidase
MSGPAAGDRTAEDRAVEVLDHLRGRQDEMVELLRSLVRLESPSDDAPSQTAVRDAIATELERLGFRTRAVRARSVGRHLFARPAVRAPGRPVQLVVGHIDTVWPIGTVAEREAGSDETVVTGPGTFDMKGGLVQLLFALSCISSLGLDTPASTVVLINADEEIGSPDSRRWITTLARMASRAFVLEGAANPGGALKVGRKGVGRYVVRAKGRAAHAGLDPENGASAVLELSFQIQRLFALNNPDQGITVNVGTIDGGLRPNVIAPEATAQIDTRVYTEEQAAHVDTAIRSLEPVNPDVSLEVEGGFGRPPMERTPANEALWQTASHLADRLGIELDAAVVGGASDGNLISPYTATLDGLGAVGDGAHRLDEYVLIEAMPQRAALLALLLTSPLTRQEVSR